MSWRVGLPALAALLSACASTPRALPDYDDVVVDAYVQGSDKHPISGTPVLPGGYGRTLEGVSCVLRNGRGEWTVVPPAKVRVPRSPQALEFECTKEGFLPARGNAGCFTVRRQRQIGDTLAALQLIAAVPLVVVAAPVAPGIAAYGAVQGAGAGASLASSRAAAEDSCIYRRLDVPMTPQAAPAVNPPRP